ncbi:probable deoxyhypusine synthase [Parasteatoda tepidariorum]|uniref:probable deoxyhypusine synthase n=1 Tax=Parasteatoda tepidariorum TaxID=114398 RepID=UPI00077FDF02|nr:probable deoxyhypusine synthase [Parasteatoda tepidariorum]XP_015926980.1 probable deoxyhypusine synthase [Parasteatoda tepidariorum]XP_015926982.1 probable deoxyhypusine synthase [Parasteatoda tepidariorum]
MSAEQGIPAIALDAVLKKSSALPKNKVPVKGYDFNDGVDYHALLQSYKTSGFQATNFGLAVEEINKMISCRNEPFTDEDVLETDPFIKRRTNCSIFLGYTSNMASAGVRDTIRYLVQHKLIDCIVTSAGGVEEDLIKCLAPTILGDFSLDGAELRDKGLNRIGNLLVPNENYCLFENWVIPILDECLEEQHSKNNIWSPSKIITRLGQKIGNTESICYWAAKNEIPIFCPALTDGSLGDMMFFHSFRKKPELIVDINQDLRRIHSIALKAVNSGMIILGGGVVKHHICNSNLMRNGADYAVFINTAHEFDGSDSGARPDEAVSWGKIKKSATPVKVYADATLVFPLIVAETFAPYVHNREGQK